MSVHDNPIDHHLAEEAENEKIRAEAVKQELRKLNFITRWSERLSRSRRHDKDARDRWADDRRVARGDTGWLVDTNLIGSIMEVLAAFLYARNPDLEAKPSASVGRKRIPEYKKVASTLEIMVSRMLKDASLKRKAKKWVRGSMTVGISWMRVAMQTRQETVTLDPIVQNQINDLRQNRDRLEALERMQDQEEEKDSDVTLSEIDSQIIALEAKKEITVAEGAVIDIFAPEDVIVASECGDIENYINAPYIAFDMYKSIDEAYEITKWESEEDLALLKTANRFAQRPRRGENDDTAAKGGSKEWTITDDEAEFENGFLRFTEIWSKTDGVIYTLIDGIHKKWGREPYAPVTGKRWYPLFDLPAHIIDGERWPQSDVYQLKRLQDEYGRTRSNFAEHRRRAVPGMIFDLGAVQEESIKKLNESEIQEYVGVEMVTAGADIRTAVTPKAYAAIDPALYDTRVITQEMEKISGAQDALQSSVQVEKTATEAKIQEAGFGARSGARRDTMEDSLTEMSEYMAQLCLQLCDQADAIAYAGPEAVWVEMTTDEALMFFDITVKAGSTGKPSVNNDREIWGTLMPLIERMIDRIGQARLVGAEWAAKPWIALLNETMQRLDDSADLGEFLPEPPPPSGEAAEPSDLEKSEIEANQSKALKDRSDVIEKLSEIFTRPEAAEFLFNGGKYQQPPPAAAPPQAQLTDPSLSPPI